MKLNVAAKLFVFFENLCKKNIFKEYTYVAIV